MGLPGRDSSCLDPRLQRADFRLYWKTGEQRSQWSLSGEGLERVKGKWNQEMEGCPKGIFDNTGLPLLKAVCAFGEIKRAPQEQRHLLQFVQSPLLTLLCAW